MFDFHIHSAISFDSTTPSADIARAAAERGLKEICFTDHWDYLARPEDKHDLFSLEEYSKAYDGLDVRGLTIRRGIELGLNEWNVPHCKDTLAKRPFDFVIGSVHYVEGNDPYYAEFWKGRTVENAYSRYMEKVLECVRIHEDFDVLGHLNYVCKSPENPFKRALYYSECREIADEIMKILVSKGKGMEINTSGIMRGVDFLPSEEYLRRFKELGGEIITVGSDAHNAPRVGEYCGEAIELARSIFGHVCTFEGRRPVFHKL